MRFSRLSRRLATTSSLSFLAQRYPPAFVGSSNSFLKFTATSFPTVAMTTTADPASSGTSTEYVPPKVWTWDAPKGDNQFASINQPTAGARFDRELPRGDKHALQLYSLATPNGQKVTILLEELLAAGVGEAAEYDAWMIKIMDQDQFSSGFVAANPNSKIPALLDYSQSKDEPVRVFESGAILLYLAEKFAGQHPFLPSEQRTEVLNWLFWQMGAAPYVGGGFGHFFAYAKEKLQYPIDRFTMETKRQLDVLDKQLAKTNAYIVGDTYTIADMAIFPWYGSLVLGQGYSGADVFLNVAEDYPHVIRWAKEIAARPAVQRGRSVNKAWGDGPHAPERHEAADIDKALKEYEEKKAAEEKE